MYLYLACAVLILPMMALVSATVTSSVSRLTALENEVEVNADGKGKVERVAKVLGNDDDTTAQQMKFQLPKGCEPLSRCKAKKQCKSYRRGEEGCSGKQNMELHISNILLHTYEMSTHVSDVYMYG